MCNRLIFSIGDNRSMKNVEYDKIYGIIEPFMNVDYMVYQLKYDNVHNDTQAPCAPRRMATRSTLS